MPGRRQRTSLRHGIDDEVYTVAIKLLEDHSLEPSAPALYQAIQRSTLPLRRQPKKTLMDALERVLSALDDDNDEEAALEAATTASQPSSSINIMNRSLVSAWKPTTTSGPGTDAGDQSGAATPLRAQSNEPQRKRKREEREREREPKKVYTPPTGVSTKDFGGIQNVVDQLEEMVLFPLRRTSKYSTMSLPLPRGILLHGPPGCGKSRLARALAADIKIPLVEIAGPSIVSGMSGESEKQVRDAFEEARTAAPCILFIDEIDVIAPKRESSQSQMEKRIVAQLLISMDTLATDSTDPDSKPVIVLAATNRPDSLDPALRRGGRFDTEINMGVPNEKARAEILQALMKNTPINPDIDFSRLARLTAGYVGADLQDLVGKAGTHVMKQYRKALKAQILAPQSNGAMDIDSVPKTDLAPTSLALFNDRLCDDSIPEPDGFENMTLTMDAFLSVIPTIVPSSKREGFATVPDTTWENIGALAEVRESLQQEIVRAIATPEAFAGLGLPARAGVLLWGPPGCGKTLLAKAVANESKANFISVKGPELLNKYVGESERAVRTVFTRARSSVPCVIFFDELDALVPRREDGTSEASARVVNTLLTELDGVGSGDGIYIIAATNRPDMIDNAMLRPGRLGQLLFVGLPGSAERVEILDALMMSRRKKNSAAWPDRNVMARLIKQPSCQGFSGADLEAVLQAAAHQALRNGRFVVEDGDFEKAVVGRSPSVSAEAMVGYERLKEKFRVET